MEGRKTLMEDKGLTRQRDEGGKEDVRCICNRLICVCNGSTLEIKCSKCKRLIQIETAGIMGVKIC
ncbi:hypothetical protein Tph_c18340 [Thermacetogenium phaeum DSM 12270]|jgi:hypothetical protein|uniref:Uncharacterized protein n=3 Tax=Thermacetogenium phaeum TaxID=85874 RepID=K4LG86_THEPS|nr:hypothetical protein Tph_c18340 [Thermacetogenium phaeum DSM 12270]KUK35895.1 MAG: Uncharacterized protein XD66_1397 [Thermacetogenium phaeum]MDK2880841.1 hypothetical protein [Clostridia bacterium]MDN5375940.1 hypothetical protein [Thermacetogenium sp.]